MWASCISCKKCFVEIKTVSQLTLFFQILRRLAILCIRCFMLSRKLLKHWLRVLHICKINWLVKMVVCYRPLVCTIWSWLRIRNPYKWIWSWFFLNDVFILIWYILRIYSSNGSVIMAFKLFFHSSQRWPWWVNILSLKRHTHTVFILLLHCVKRCLIFILRLFLILYNFVVGVKMS